MVAGGEVIGGHLGARPSQHMVIFLLGFYRAGLGKISFLFYLFIFLNIPQALPARYNMLFPLLRISDFLLSDISPSSCISNDMSASFLSRSIFFLVLY